MSDLKWGFEKPYGHKTLPPRWVQGSGYSVYHPDPLSKKSFRKDELPVYRDDFRPKATRYEERSQCDKYHSSAYGCHMDLNWGISLRNPRNPFPGKAGRETHYRQEPTPMPRSRSSSPTSVKGSTMLSARRAKVGLQATHASMAGKAVVGEV
mmetsp:Transcript_19988/g.46515  ORF Transcript_19988/g.46515 Transcript_19988/m.46515 type:complete len:152 (-) Transcript_19988:151-606(-)